MSTKPYKSKFLNIINDRGFIYQSAEIEALDKLLSQEKIKAYIGFDCTAKSLHIGSLVPIMLLRHLQKCGHTPVVLFGTGTTKIGDPSGKDKERNMLSPAVIKENMEGIKKIFARYLDCSENLPNKVIFVENNDWLENINYIDFLRDFGKHFTINRMLSFESVKLRLDREQPLSFLEFNYMLLQAYDFMYLNKNMGVKLQMGGSDQWGNIINGIEISRKLNGENVFGITSPLLTTADGKKMGKTQDGAIWLDSSMLDSWSFWQFWRNIDDRDVIKFMKLFTEIPLEEIEQFSNSTGQEINELKKILATEVTKICRGEKEAIQALQAAEQNFENGGSLDISALPSANIMKEQILTTKLIDLLVAKGIKNSKSEIRRLIDNKGLKINDTKCENYDFILSQNDFVDNKYVKLSFGKKEVFIINIIQN